MINIVLPDLQKLWAFAIQFMLALTEGYWGHPTPEY